MRTVDSGKPLTGDERAIEQYMRQLESETAGVVPALPGADVVWLKARLIQRWQAERRVEQPLDRMYSIHLALGVAAAVVVIAWAGPALVRSLSSLTL